MLEGGREGGREVSDACRGDGEPTDDSDADGELGALKSKRENGNSVLGGLLGDGGGDGC